MRKAAALSLALIGSSLAGCETGGSYNESSGSYGAAPAYSSAYAPTPVPAPAYPGSAFETRHPYALPPRAGLVTAGTYDDLRNPQLYAHYVGRFLAREPMPGIPRLDTRRVLTVAVSDSYGRPMPFAAVTVHRRDRQQGTVQLRTLADGTAVFFPDSDGLTGPVDVTVRAPDGQVRTGTSANNSDGGRMDFTMNGPAQPVRKVDLALAVDTTGSMGDEIAYLQAELRGIVQQLMRRHPGIDLRVAVIPYRDRGEAYVVRRHALTRDLEAMQRVLNALHAEGGGDDAEAMEAALQEASTLDWRDDAAKALLVVADAPPHGEDLHATWSAAQALRGQRVQIVPVSASGSRSGAEYVMRAMAALTQSRFVFLTDDSGIGNPHAEPEVDCYSVTSLNGALLRILDDHISGRRTEPAPHEVVRRVGMSDDGRCVLGTQTAWQQ